MCAAESGNKEELVEAVYLSQKEFNINYPKKLRSGMNGKIGLILLPENLTFFI
jgi:hypothetical protein